MSRYKQVKINLDEKSHKELENKAVSLDMNIAEFVRFELGIEFSAKSRFRKNRTQNNMNKLDSELLYLLSSISREMNLISRKLEAGETDTRLLLITLFGMTPIK